MKKYICPRLLEHASLDEPTGTKIWINYKTLAQNSFKILEGESIAAVQCNEYGLMFVMEREE